MKDTKGTDLHPPVLPSWGSMLPASPPSGYGTIRFDPNRPQSEWRDDANTDVDDEALAMIADLFPSSH